MKLRIDSSNLVFLTVHLLGSDGRPWSGGRGICSSTIDGCGIIFSKVYENKKLILRRKQRFYFTRFGSLIIGVLFSFDCIEHNFEQNFFPWSKNLWERSIFWHIIHRIWSLFSFWLRFSLDKNGWLLSRIT